MPSAWGRAHPAINSMTRKPVAIEVPAEWVPRTLAREYLRTLLQR